MALGDHPGGFAGACWVFTNAESVRLYRGNDFIAEFTPDRRGRFAALPHPPIEVQDFVGRAVLLREGRVIADLESEAWEETGLLQTVKSAYGYRGDRVQRALEDAFGGEE